MAKKRATSGFTEAEVDMALLLLRSATRDHRPTAPSNMAFASLYRKFVHMKSLMEGVDGGDEGKAGA